MKTGLTWLTGRRACLALALPLGLLGACGGGPGPDIEARGDIVYVTTDGEQIVPVTYEAADVEAHLRAEDGTRTPLAIDMLEDGFVIRDVPDDALVHLRIRDTYLITDRRELDLGYAVLGRADAVEARSPETTLSFDLEGMQPWQAIDHLELYVPNSGGQTPYFETWLDPLAEGTEVVQGSVEYGWSTGIPMLANASRGDRGHVTHMVGRTVAGGLVGEVREVAVAEPYTQADGAEAVVAGTFAPVEMAGGVELEIPVGALREAVAEAFPDTTDQLTADFHNTFVSTLPQASEHGGYSTPLSLATFEPDEQSGMQQVTIEYPVLFGDADDPFVTIGHYALRTLPVGQEGGFVTAGAYLFYEQPALGGPRPPGTVPLSVPRDLRLDGQPTTQQLDGVGLTPSLSWTAPATGEPLAYEVAVVRVVPDDDRFRRETAAVIITEGTEMVIPEGVLVAGERYLFTVRATRPEGVDLLSAPFRTARTQASATALTSVVSIQ